MEIFYKNPLRERISGFFQNLTRPLSTTAKVSKEIHSVDVLEEGEWEWQKEKEKLMANYNKLGSYVAIVLYPLWSLLDYYMAPESLKTAFYIERFVVAFLILMSMLLSRRLKWPHEIPVYAILLLIGTHIGYTCSEVSAAELSAYMLEYSTLFICAGMILLWDIKHSLLVVVTVPLIFLGFNQIGQAHSAEVILTNGGLLTISVLVVYVVLKAVRMRLHKKEFISRFTLNIAMDELQQKNQIISKKSSKITKSINYAKRIQEAILPKEEKLEKNFSNHFIYFQPKDIVSGDFYWFAEKDGKFFVTAADCTGHGVPGALMSMIGVELLNKIVFAEDISSPDKILNKLHQQIRKTLKQQQSNNRDGMDMALCVIDRQEQKLEFAGAKNPLIYVRKGKFRRIKGDKMPIGGVQKEQVRNFQNHSLPFDEHTSIYMFSDGFQDQFGGKEGRKFYSRRFLKLLEYLSQKPMAVQKSILQERFKKWRANSYRQVDDVLVMGLKG